MRALLSALVALIAVCASALLPSSVLAEYAPLPQPMPAGYSVVYQHGTRWVYPNGAKSEVDALRATQRSVWAELSSEFGVALAPELDIRVALNPDQMQALAPSRHALPGYATGVAFPAEGLIMLSMAEPESWVRPDMQRVFTHELAHVALERATLGHEVPRWFTEGVAVIEADEHSLERVKTLWEGTLAGQLIDLPNLTNRFPSRHGEVNLAYAQAADLVGHMLAGDQGRKSLRVLIAALREGKPFEQAITVAYRMPLWRIELQWRAALTQRFGRWPSILTGLTVVWGIGALLLVIGYVRVRRQHHQTLKRWAIEEAPPLAVLSLPPPPPPPTRHVADDVLDAWTEHRRREPEIPTVVHEGRNHTLH